MNSSSLFSELAMAFKRTIIPINPYQTSQSHKSDSSTTNAKHAGNGTNLSNPGQLDKGHASQSAHNKDSEDYKPILVDTNDKQDTACQSMRVEDSGSTNLIDNVNEMHSKWK